MSSQVSVESLSAYWETHYGKCAWGRSQDHWSGTKVSSSGPSLPSHSFFQAENNALGHSSHLNNTRVSSVSFAESFIFCVFHAASIFGSLLLRNPAGHQKLDMAEKKKAQEFIHLFLCNSPWAYLLSCLLEAANYQPYLFKIKNHHKKMRGLLEAKAAAACFLSPDTPQPWLSQSCHSELWRHGGNPPQ